MKAIVFAAGRGERMQPYTNTIPKVLLPVAGKPLVSYLLTHLARQGFTDVIMNIAHLAEQFESTLGNGAAYGVNITYSFEQEALETGGGIVKMLPLLDNEPFLAVSGDIWTEYPFANLVRKSFDKAHLILVRNPAVKESYDFGLVGKQVVLEPKQYVFASMGLYHPSLFDGYAMQKFSMIQPLKIAIEQEQVSGEFYNGPWLNVGTPTLLAQMEKRIAK